MEESAFIFQMNSFLKSKLLIATMATTATYSGKGQICEKWSWQMPVLVNFPVSVLTSHASRPEHVEIPGGFST